MTEISDHLPPQALTSSRPGDFLKSFLNGPSVAEPAFRKEEDAASYDAHAQAYDRYVRRLSAPLARHICQLARIKPGDRVLDVGTGTGVAARAAAHIVGPSGYVLGIDLSKGMIRTATRSTATAASGAGAAGAAGASARPLEFRVMDAELLHLPNADFDAVVSLCAVLHFPQIANAMDEMYRVVRPGGRLVVSFGRGKPIAPLPLAVHFARKLARMAMRPLRPVLEAPGDLSGMVLSGGEEHGHFVTEWSRHRPQQALVEAVRAAGFVDVQVSWCGHRMTIESAEEFWEAQTAIVTSVRKTLKSMAPADVEALRRNYIERVQRVLDRGGSLAYPYGALYVSATRPA